MAATAWPDGTPPTILYQDRGHVLARGGEAVLGSTMERADYDSRVTNEGLAQIFRGAVRLLPALITQPVQRMWAGLRPATPDGRPILGRDPEVERLWYATGHGRNGILPAALIRWQHYDFVRVGKPRRLEFATWRYGERLKARRREQLKFVLPVTVAAVGLAVAENVTAGGSFGVFVCNIPRGAQWLYTRIVGRRSVGVAEPPICERCGTVLQLRARHVAYARVVGQAQGAVALILSCPNCHDEGTMLVGRDAHHALRQGLTYLALARAGRQRVEDAARLVEGAGGQIGR